jgi:hypothetical protein
VHAGANVGITLRYEIVSPPRDLVDMLSSSRRRFPNRHILVVTNGQVSHQRDCMFSSSRRRLPNRHNLVVTNGQVSHQRDCMFSSSRRRLPNRHILVVTNGHPIVHWKRLCSPNRPSAPKCSAALLRDTYCILINDTLFTIDYSNHRLSYGVIHDQVNC